MTPLRQRMMEDLQLKGYSDSTQKLYASAVRQLCDHFNKPPGRITEDDLRKYFLYGKNVKNGLAAPALWPCAASNFSMITPLSALGQHYFLFARAMKKTTGRTQS